MPKNHFKTNLFLAATSSSRSDEVTPFVRVLVTLFLLWSIKTCCTVCTVCNMQFATCYLQHAICIMQFATCKLFVLFVLLALFALFALFALCALHCCTVALLHVHFAVWVSCHSSGSLEGGCPSSAEVIEDTGDFLYYSGFYRLFSVPKDLQYMFDRFLILSFQRFI